MANICDFNMMVKGNRDDIEKFYCALTQATTKVWIGEGADANINYGDGYAYIDGWCRWSVRSALISYAASMAYQKKTGNGYWDEKMISDVDEFISLFSACKKYHLNMEVFSYESDIGFSEHFKYENEELVANEECDYDEHSGGFKCEFNLADVKGE